MAFLHYNPAFVFYLNITKSSLRMAPFLIGYLFNYVFSTGNYLSLTGNTGNTSLIQSFIRVVFIDRNFTYLLTPFQTLENIFIPDNFILPTRSTANSTSLP